MSRRIWIGPIVRVFEDITDEDLGWLKQKKFLKVMDESARRSLQAAYLAIDKSGDLGAGSSCGIALSLPGVASGAGDWNDAIESFRKKCGREPLSSSEIGNCLPPLALIPRLPNSVAGHIAREFGITGPCWTSAAEDSAGLDAIVQGARWIEDEECRWVVVVRIEADGALAAVLTGEPGPGRQRQIFSWSASWVEGSATDPETKSLQGIGDWPDVEVEGVFRSGNKEAGYIVEMRAV